MLRRLQLKVVFGYLDVDQIKEILAACVTDSENAGDLPLERLAGLDRVTPGLIRTALENLRLQGYRPRVEKALEALRDEQQSQEYGPSKQPIGFVS